MGIDQGRVAYPGEVDPHPDQAVKKKLDPDPTMECNRIRMPGLTMPLTKIVSHKHKTIRHMLRQLYFYFYYNVFSNFVEYRANIRVSNSGRD